MIFKNVEFMTMNHLPKEMGNSGFGLGFGVTTDVTQAKRLGSEGSYAWGGAASTNFWIDPEEEMIGLILTQFMPSSYYPTTNEFIVLVYQAIID